MVIDTSALVAILLQEPDAWRYAEAIEGDDTRIIPAPTWVEVGLVILTRRGPSGLLETERFATEASLQIASLTAEHARLAIAAFRYFGKGRHRAGLNYGDCFSYALAKDTGEPLLFKGDDFSKTDIMPAMPRLESFE